MCWSAQADAVVGGAVTGVGVACPVRSRRSGPPQRLLLAALPLVLGVHQLIEALVWRGTDGELPSAVAGAARTAWAAIALPLLPALAPTGVVVRGPGAQASGRLEPAPRARPAHPAGRSSLDPPRGRRRPYPVTACRHGHTLGCAIRHPACGPPARRLPPHHGRLFPRQRRPSAPLPRPAHRSGCRPLRPVLAIRVRLRLVRPRRLGQPSTPPLGGAPVRERSMKGGLSPCPSPSVVRCPPPTAVPLPARPPRPPSPAHRPRHARARVGGPSPATPAAVRSAWWWRSTGPRP